MASAGGIESQNVVGYQEVATPSGYSMRVPTFKAINGNYKIADIRVNGAEGVGSDSIQKVNADGTWGEVYYYLTEDGMGVEDGWYKKDMETPVDDVDVIGVGEAFYVSAGSDMIFTYAGEVLSGKPVVDVAAGYSMVGNPTPVPTKVSDIRVSGAEGVGSDSVQKVNADGTWGDVYYYLTEDGMGVEDGWYNGDMETPIDDGDILIAGDGLFVSAGGDLTLTFPAALSKEVE